MTVARGASLSRLAWPLVALSLFGVGVTAILAFTTLWETPDTNCGQLLNPTGDICDAITDRRATWVLWTGALTLVVVVLTLVASAGRRRVSIGYASSRVTLAALALLVVTLGAGLYGTWRLAHGSESGNCGSTLSRVDPFGRYSSARPAECAPAYAADRHAAGVAGGVAAVTFLAAVGITVASGSTSSRRTRRLDAHSGPGR